MQSILRVELWKATHNIKFYIALTAGVLFAVLDAILTGNVPLYGVCMIVSPTNLGSALFFFFWPILVALPYGWSFWKEKKDQSYIQIEARVCRKEFLWAKFMAVFISGGIVMSIPILLNILILALFHPYEMPHVLSGMNALVNGYFLSSLYHSNLWLFLFIWCLVDFLWGGVIACFCLVVGSKPTFQVMVILTPYLVLLALEIILNTFLYGPNFTLYEVCPMELAKAGTLSANPGWIIFSEMGLFAALDIGLGYWQVVKHEL